MLPATMLPLAAIYDISKPRARSQYELLKQSQKKRSSFSRDEYQGGLASAAVRKQEMLDAGRNLWAVCPLFSPLGLRKR